jgi:hypothetical protein
VIIGRLSDGTSHPASIVLNIPARNLEVRITKSN